MLKSQPENDGEEMDYVMEDVKSCDLHGEQYIAGDDCPKCKRLNDVEWMADAMSSHGLISLYDFNISGPITQAERAEWRQKAGLFDSQWYGFIAQSLTCFDELDACLTPNTQHRDKINFDIAKRKVEIAADIGFKIIELLKANLDT